MKSVFLVTGFVRSSALGGAVVSRPVGGRCFVSAGGRCWSVSCSAVRRVVRVRRFVRVRGYCVRLPWARSRFGSYVRSWWV